MLVKIECAKMKRDCEGNPLPVLVCHDLQEKIRALVDFTTESCSYEKYRDDFLIYIKLDDDKETGKYNIRFLWYCQKFMCKKDMFVEDSRNHEGLLRRYFTKYNVLIHKNDLNWDVLVSTPDNSSGIQRISLPSSATPN